MNSAILVVNYRKCTEPSHVDSVKELLLGHFKQVTIFNAEDEWTRFPTADLAVVMGGDGTIIHTSRHMLDKQIPIAGINYGKLGYLANFTYDEFSAYLKNVQTEMNEPGHRYPFHATSRLLINTSLIRGDVIKNSVCVNDCVIDIGPPFRITEIEVWIGKNNKPPVHFSTIRGDGVIVSTPTGSTAYCTSAGGPIVQSGIDAIILTPKNPHKLSIRPVVISSEETIYLRMKSAEGTWMILDGQDTTPLMPTDEIKISPCNWRMVIVENPFRDYWTTLTDKLNWGK